MLKITPHGQGQLGCNPSLHCHTHDLDEPVAPSYVTCFECGHVFPSAWALWRDRVAAALRLHKQAVRWYGRRYARAFVLNALLTRPSEVYACPHCTHDF